MVAQGIFFGVLSACFSSFTFLFNRAFSKRPVATPVGLFIFTHIWMGSISLVLMALLHRPGEPGLREYAGPLAWAAGWYIVGQILFFNAVRNAEASRLSPLLGLKMLVLALVTVLVLRHHLSGLKWLAVGVAMLAAVGLNYSGGELPRRALAAMLGAVFCYALSDLGVAKLAGVFSPDGSLRGNVYAASMNYVLCMMAGLAMIPLANRAEISKESLIASLPMGICWLLAGLTLFACFRAIGPLFGNIVQSLRGPFSVLLGVPIAALGHVHLEQRLTKRILISRLAAALLMCLAIALFARG